MMVLKHLPGFRFGAGRTAVAEGDHRPDREADHARRDPDHSSGRGVSEVTPNSNKRSNTGMDVTDFPDDLVRTQAAWNATYDVDTTGPEQVPELVEQRPRTPSAPLPPGHCARPRRTLRSSSLSS
jgi:hypothetical protein